MASNLLGVDYGRVRIGLAIAREGVVEPLKTLATANHPEVALTALVELIAAEKIDTVVVGLPRGDDGQDSPWTSEVRSFIADLRQKVGQAVAVQTQDEFGTSEQARRRLPNPDSPATRRLGLVDQQSAIIILEDYLRDR